MLRIRPLLGAPLNLVTAIVVAVMCTAATALVVCGAELVEGSAATDELPEGLVDTRNQADIREQHGKPDAFSVLYYDEPGADGAVEATTMSQWRYYAQGLELTFADGQLLAEDTIELAPGVEAEPVPYDPDQFSAYMSLDEVLAAAGLEDYLGGPVDDLVDGGELYFADRLTWGMKDGELRYLEAVALEADDVGEGTE